MADRNIRQINATDKSAPGRSLTISRGCAIFIAISFCCLIWAVPSAQWIWDYSRMASAGRHPVNTIDILSDLIPSISRLRTVQESSDIIQLIPTSAQIRRVETRIEEASVLTHQILPAVQGAFTRFLGVGNKQTYIGKDGWLYYRPDVDHITGPGFLNSNSVEPEYHMQNDPKRSGNGDPVTIIIGFRDYLAGLNIRLVVVPVPSKCAIYPEKLNGADESNHKALVNISYHDALKMLKSAGIEMISLHETFMNSKKGSESLYLRMDSHWTPAAVDLAANEIAGYITKNKIVPKGRFQYVRDSVKVDGFGDIVGMLSLKDPSRYFKKQQVSLFSVSLSNSVQALPRSSAILFLGDSFSNIYSKKEMKWGQSAGLVEQLRYYLKQPIDSITINDKGAMATRSMLYQQLKKNPKRLAGKKLVIWEFAEREFSSGHWKAIPFELPGAALTDTKAAPQFSGRVTGQVAYFSDPPIPGTVPYADAIVAVHLKNVQWQNTAGSNADIIVFTWGMRDNKRVDASLFQVGNLVRINVLPWEQVDPQYGSFQRIELDSDYQLALQTYWYADSNEEGGARALENTAPQPDSGLSAPPALNRAGGMRSMQRPQGLRPRDFIDEASRIAQRCSAQGQYVFPGADGWLFFSSELRHVGTGQFWGAASRSVSNAMREDAKDPLPAIIDFKRRLDTLGIQLILVPVPAKAFVYPDKLMPEAFHDNQAPMARYDIYHQDFFRLLDHNDILAVDLLPDYLTARRNSNAKVYCKQDTHWSPKGISIAARSVARIIKQQEWYPAWPKTPFRSTKQNIMIHGDLKKMRGKSQADLESITIHRVEKAQKAPTVSGDSTPEHPILVLGDSHGLVFHSGKDMHASHAGLSDVLAEELEIPIDLIAVRGSGGTQPRLNLVRKKGALNGKKIVVWVFTSRAFTEDPTGWIKVPVHHN